MFQRAYLTAQSLGVAEKAHDAMYDAIWNTGELGVADPTTRRLKTNLPTIEDAARFYQRVAGVKAADFVNASKSFSVDLKMRQADGQIIAMQVSGTPTLVVNGKYRVNNENLATGRDRRAGEVPGRDGKRTSRRTRRDLAEEELTISSSGRGDLSCAGTRRSRAR